MIDMKSAHPARPLEVLCRIVPAQGDEVPASLRRTFLPEAGGTLLTLDGLAASDIRQARILLSVPILDMTGIYLGGDPGPEFGHLPFWHHEKHTRANSGFPYVALHNANGLNRMAIGLVDQLLDCAIGLTLDEAGRCYHIEICARLSPADRERLDKDGLTLFIRDDPAPWHDVLGQYRALAESALPAPPIAVPAAAFDPVFCTWTAAHHGITGQWCEATARMAADLGFGTWLTDDGWFTQKAEFGRYDHVGDWQPDPEKFPGFRDHVGRVRDMGLRYLIWVSPLMVGPESMAHASLADNLTQGRADLHAGHLSPTAPGAADHVAELLERLLTDYGLDGFKIDFIDALETAVCPSTNTNDNFGAATLGLLRRAVDRVLAHRPDALIEFRNTYTNLAAAALANIYRASDVPLNPDLNLWQVTMLRLMAPGRAIHMDPMFWHPEESDRNVALQLMRGLAGVPMVSVRLTETRASHLALIRHWLDFYTRHRATLWHGAFVPVIEGRSIRQLGFSDAARRIVIALGDSLIECPATLEEQIVLNASAQGSPVLALAAPSRLSLFDMWGKALDTCDVEPGLVTMDVEPGGVIVITPGSETDVGAVA